MSSRAGTSGFDSLVRSLAARRFVIYAGGLAVISLPRALRAGFEIEVPATARTAIVVFGLGAMILTYLGERRVDADADRERTAPNTAGANATHRTEADERTPAGSDPDDPNDSDDSDDPGSTARSGSTYSRRTRRTVAIGLAGIAIGIYVAVEVDTVVGALFVVGGVLFGGSAYRIDRTNDGEGG